MKLTIVLHQPYPHGFACSNRIHLYSKGVRELGGEVEILVPRPTELDNETAKNYKISGVHEGVAFHYTCGATIRPESFFKRRYVNAKGVVKGIIRLYRERDKVDAILLVTNELRSILVFSIAAKLLGIIVLQEKSELPFYNKQPRNLLENIYQYLYISYCYKLFDGMVVISKTLYEYFQPKIKKTASLLLVPVIMDPAEFECTPESTKGSYVVYCGNFTQNQDGILTLIEAFKMVSDKLQHIHLRLIGEPAKKDDENAVLTLIDELGLTSRVELTGYISRAKLVQLMKSASVLVLAKPRSLQADYCFPSKLAEYLVTGNPVVVTKVGVIQDYLVHEESAYLAEPDNANEVADNIVRALSEKLEASEIGECGRQLALKEFSYQQQAKKIIDFISGLLPSPRIQ